MLKIWKFANFLYKLRVPLLPRLLYILNRVCFAVVLPPSVKIGKNVLFGYSGLGVVVHARASIGNRVNIGPRVTIGGRSGHSEVPVIEDDVLVGAGACILGHVRIGKGARIGANAVVLTDIPAGAIAVGVPANVKEKRNVTL